MEVSGLRDLIIARGKQVEVETRTDRTRIAAFRRHDNDEIENEYDIMALNAEAEAIRSKGSTK